MDQALNSQKTPHTSPLRASYGMSFVSILMKNDRVIKGFYCIFQGKHISDKKIMDTLYEKEASIRQAQVRQGKQ